MKLLPSILPLHLNNVLENLPSKVSTTATVPLQGDRSLREEEGNRPPVLGTATLYGWRSIRGLRQVLRAGTAGGGLFADCPRLTSSSLQLRSALVDTRMRKIVFVNLYLVYG